MNEEFNLEVLDGMPIAELKDLCSWAAYPDLWNRVQQLAEDQDSTPADVLIGLILAI